MKLIKTVIFVCLVNGACSQNKLEVAVNSLIDFSVDTLSTSSFKALVSENPNLIILDTRAQREFEVSHIEGSKFIDYESFSLDDVKGIDKNKTIVTYCSVGYRSEQIGKKLQEAGYSKVYNLYGGVFDWKNKGEKVVDNKNNKTDSVHVYNKVWGVFLEKGIKVYD